MLAIRALLGQIISPFIRNDDSMILTLKDVSGRPNDEITTNSETTGAYGMDSNHLMLAVTKYQ